MMKINPVIILIFVHIGTELISVDHTPPSVIMIQYIQSGFENGVIICVCYGRQIIPKVLNMLGEK